MILLDGLVPVFGGLAGVSAALILTGAALYDVQVLNEQRQRQLHPYAKQYRQRPLVSVIVVTQDHQATITGCLQSLIASRYHKLDIVLADNASVDQTKPLVREFMAQHPKKSLKLYAKRRPGSKQQLLKGAINKCRGDLIIVLDGGQTVDKACISQAVAHFITAESDLMMLNSKPWQSFKASGLFQEFKSLMQARSSKAASSYRAMSFVSNETYLGSVAAWSDLLKSGKKAQQAPLKIRYSHSATVYGRPLSFFELLKASYTGQAKQAKTWSKNFTRLMAKPSGWQALGLVFWATSGLTALLLPILLTYFTYLAFSLEEPAFLITSWIALSLFLLFAIWEDERLSLIAKLKYFGLMPFSYGWFYLVGIVRYLAVLAVVKPRPDTNVNVL